MSNATTDRKPVRLGKFELPNRLVKNEKTATATYAAFTAEPFETGYGYTIGNALRRILLSSIEGAAVTSIRIEGVQHEFQTIEGVVEDVTDVVLNLKRILVNCAKREGATLRIDVNKEGDVTAGDIVTEDGIEILNPELVICTIDKKRRFQAEITVRCGRGYVMGEDNKSPDQPIGVIAIDSLYSPVRNVKYAVESTRVGHMTDYDKLLLEITTDGRITPDDALRQAASILKHHLDVFDALNAAPVEFENEQKAADEDQNRLRKLLNMSVNEIELSVRAANCLNNANILTVGELAMKSEAEMLKYRNFGKKSLAEIRAKLEQLGLSLGTKIDERLLDKRS
jgi:DNA-directed RNA polymerase subunit alpha